MFRKKTAPLIDVKRISSLIAAGVEIDGDVLVTDGVRIDGTVRGNVLGKPGSSTLLVLSEKGCVYGGAKVQDAVINGTIEGDLEVERFLELQAHARVTGDIRYRQLQIEPGAIVAGRLECSAREIAESAATPSNVLTLPLPTQSGG